MFLEAYNIKAELTPSTRVGFHKYTFPKSSQSHILFDFYTYLGPSDTQKGIVKKVNNQEMEGYAIMAATIRRPKTLPVFLGIGEVKRPNRAFYFHRFAKTYPHTAILLGNYKLLKFWKTYKVDLYNLPNDLGEINDILNNEKTKTKELVGILMAYITKNNSELLTPSII